VLTLNDACERNARLLRINLNGVDADFPATLRGALSGFRGGQTALRLSYANATGNAEIELGPEWRVRATADLKRALDALPGVRGTEFVLAKSVSGSSGA
jgi:DNA polymerase-3 subunit alpha